MKTLPYIMEPMITRLVTDKIVIAEIYLRLLCGLAYRQTGEDSRAAADKEQKQSNSVLLVKRNGK